MAQGLERESKEQTRSKDTDEKISKFVRCGEGRVMGSRRIFPPQFKLQVLDSYRKDEDCKGNQRATARKYGIHRRQIQKWLQVEASLRTSVEVGSERRQASPTALNLTSAGDARQRDDSGGGGGGGGEESQLVTAAEAEPTRWPRGGERRELCEEVRRLDRIELDRRPDIPSTFLHILKDETEEEDDDEEEEDDDEEDDEEEEGVSEEDNMDPARGPYNNDEALDFSCAALGKRRSFSLQFKLEVLNAFHADGMCHGNQRATARKFGINRRQVQKWLGQEVELRGEAAFRGGLYRQRLGRWLEMEEGARKGAEDHLAAAAMSAAVMFDQYAASSEYCWDLSSKKRKLEDKAASVECKKARLSPAAGAKGAPPREDDDAEDGVKTRMGTGEARDVSSTSGRDPREDEPAAYARGRAAISAPAPPPARVPAPAPTPAPAPAAVPVPVPAPAPLDEQETALCLVKVKGEAEVTSSIDAHPFLHDPFLARHPPFHISPLALPAAAYDFYSFHCRHPCLQHLQTPKWFQSRAAAVPGFF